MRRGLPPEIDVLLAESLIGCPQLFPGAAIAALEGLLDAPEICLLFDAEPGHRGCGCPHRLVAAIDDLCLLVDTSAPDSDPGAAPSPGQLRRAAATARFDEHGDDILLAERLFDRINSYSGGGKL